MDLTPTPQPWSLFGCCRPSTSAAAAAAAAAATTLSDHEEESNEDIPTTLYHQTRKVSFDIPQSIGKNHTQDIKVSDGSIYRETDILAAKADMQTKMAALLMDLEVIKASNAKQVEIMQKELVTTQKEKNSMDAKISEISIERDELLAEKDSMQQRIESLLVEVAHVTSANADEVQSLQTELETAKKIQGNVRDDYEIARLKNELKRSQSTHANTSSVRDNLSQENELLQEKVDMLQISLKEVTAESKLCLGNLQLELELAREQLEDTESNNKKLEDELEGCKGEIEGANANIALLESDLLHSKNLAKSLEGSHAEALLLSEEKSTLATQKEELDQQVASLLVKLDNMKGENESLIAELDKANAATNRVQEHLQAELDKMQKSLDATASRRDQVLAEKNLIQQEMTDTAKVKDELLAEIESLQQSLESLKSKVKDRDNLQKDLEAVAGEKDDLLAEQSNMQNRVEFLESKVSEISATKEAEIATLRKELQEVRSCLFDDTTNWGEPNGEHSAENEHLKHQIETLQSDVSQISVMRDELTAENCTLQEQIKSISAARKEEVEKLHDELKSVKRQLTDELANCQTSLESASAQLNAALAERDELNREMTKRLDEMIEQKQVEVEMAKEIETLTTEVEQANSKYSAAKTELDIAKLTATSNDPFLVQRSQSLLGMTTVENSDAHLLEDIFSVPPAEPVSSDIIVHGFSHQGLTVEFKCNKPDTSNRQVSILVAKFINTTTSTMEGLHLQVAVPKYVKLHMQPPTSTTIMPAGSNAKEVTQTIRVTNTMLGTKDLRLKLNASFSSKGVKVQHVTTSSGFPLGQF